MPGFLKYRNMTGKMFVNKLTPHMSHFTENGGRVDGVEGFW